METPETSGGYRRPRSPFLLSILSVASAASVVVLFAVLHFQKAHRLWSPGPLTSAHAAFDGACERCHGSSGAGANALCLRCHDSEGTGHLDLTAHVIGGGGDPQRAPELSEASCSRCHVEHQGREANLAPADRAECGSCHFKGFEVHPDFEVLCESSSAGTPGIQFSHLRHLKELLEKQGLEARQACYRCHEPSGTDFAALSFDRHCGSCHLVDGSLGMVPPLSVADVAPPEAIPMAADGFERSRGRIGKNLLRHQDEWVLHNVAKLRRELGDGRPVTAVRPQMSLARLDDVWTLVETSGDNPMRARARRLRQEAASLAREEAVPSPLSKEDFERRCEEIFRLLGVIEGIQDPELQQRSRELRARVAALAPGASSAVEPTRKKEALEILTASCATCHLPSPVPVFQVSAARPVLTRSRFSHRPHLLQLEGDCSRCHAGVETSASSLDVNFGGVASCQRCHCAEESRKDCRFCHRYHAPEESP